MQFKLPLEYKVLLTEAALEDLHLKAGVTSPLNALADLDLVDDGLGATGEELLQVLGGQGDGAQDDDNHDEGVKEWIGYNCVNSEAKSEIRD